MPVGSRGKAGGLGDEVPQKLKASRGVGNMEGINTKQPLNR